MPELTLDQARSIVRGAFEAARKMGLRPLSVVVLDAGGHVTAFERQDGSSNLRFEVARGKASGALALGMGSRAIMARAAQDPAFVAALSAIFTNGIVPVPGGVLIVDSSGRIAGAVGVSGDKSDNDETAAIAGIASVGFMARAD